MPVPARYQKMSSSPSPSKLPTIGVYVADTLTSLCGCTVRTRGVPHQMASTVLPGA
ncbi:MAG TPA: hypothetical protein VHF47_11435 [Acidimicrobiales bacterium]|nr:hypothetical protein [Acidimicrobiales bacterium]